MKIHWNRPTIRLVSYLCAATAAFGILAGVNYERAKTYKRYMDNSYQHAFDEMVTAVGEIDSALQKTVLATSAGLAGNLCTEVFGKAMTAQMSIGALPWSSEELEQTAGFVSRVGDYAFSLSRAAASGQMLTEEQLENLRRLSDTASVLSLNLKGLQSDLQAGRLTLNKLERAQDTLDNAEHSQIGSAGDGIRLIEQEFPETPSLIYDGPFSEHLSGAAPKALEGLAEVDAEAARDAAASFLGVSRARVVPAGDCVGDIPCRMFTAEGEDGAVSSVEVTNAGGRVLGMLSSRAVGDAAVDAETAVETAKDFLLRAGYSDMAETYHMTQGNILTANFAWKQGDVICYSDLVKVSVALDTGAVCGFEAKGYLMAHHPRELPEAAVSEEEAMARVPAALQILSAQMALVPSEGKYETLCREFKCQSEDGRHCLIYVNAVTGEQEKILILLEDESGTLAI